MEQVLEVFYRVIKDYTDIRWGKTRDDLISKIVKVLRSFQKGKSLEDVLSEGKLLHEVESSLEYLYKFSKDHGKDIDKLIGALSVFLRSPSPCKMKIIGLMEVFFEDRRSTKAGNV
ncbi:MAG: hypothetical protein ACK4SM_04720 [Aquificaceae bacterium]